MDHPENTTPYIHIHFPIDGKYSFNVDGNIVRRKSKEIHILWDGNMDWDTGWIVRRKMRDKVLSIINSTDYWDQDLVQAIYLVGEEFRVYIIHFDDDDDLTLPWRKSKFYELIFKQCKEFEFCIFDASNGRDKRIRENYDVYSMEYIFGNIEMEVKKIISG